MRRILVTGGAGFVGSHLAIALRNHTGGPDVVALDNLRRRGAELSIERLQAAGVAFRHGDIRNPEDIAAAGPFDLLVECSAEPSVLAGYREAPDYVVNTNLAGTANCLNAARTHEAGIVFLSTSRVYPIRALNALSCVETETRLELTDEQTLPGASARGVAEQFPLEGCRSLYGTTKLCSELLMHEYLEMYDLRGVINRCGLITGPWQMGKVDQGVVVLWVARHLYGGKLSYIGYGGHGKQVRDLFHIDDLVRLVLHQIDHLDDLTGETFNVGGGRAVSTSLLELTTLCREVTGNTIDIGSVPETRPADIPVYITDHSRVSRRTGWQPQRDVRATVHDICDWLKAHREQLEPILG
jgi:CDP-paratose 2-epimerase